MKKKKTELPELVGKTRKRLHKIMRLTFLFLLLGINSIFAKESYTQNVQLDLNMNNASLGEVFNAIRKQSEFVFFYSNDQVDVSRKVDVKVKKATLNEVLDQILKGDYDYKIEDRYVLISKKKSNNDVVNIQQQAGITITGTVLDMEGEPLIGVSVTVVGKSTGTVTNVDGKYTIVIPDTKAGLRFSYVGYEPQELYPGQRHILNVTMSDTPQAIDEVVVVGYGTQKKVNLTGAVSAVKGDEINKRPIVNLSSGLQGMMTGVTVVSSANGGLPGQSGATIRVRGVGTIANSNPLVLIDGVEGDMNIINPEDIESVSVLKDAASAAIYGNRAANGVVLVTTKSVKGSEQSPQVNFNAYWGLQTPTRLPEMADAPTFMAWDTEANNNMGTVSNYKPEDIQKAINGTDPNYYANTNWIDEVFKSSAPQQNYNVSITGRGKTMGYLLSYGYLEQKGLTVGPSTKSKRNNVRLKLNTRVADILDITGNIGYVDRNYSAPSAGFAGDGGIIYNAMRTRPIVPVKFTDGGWGYGGGQSNQVALLYDGGTNDFRSQEATGNFTGKLEILKGWSASATYTFVQSNSLRELLSRTVKYYSPITGDFLYATTPTNSYENRDYTTFTQTFFAQTDYEFKVEKHTFNALAGYSQEWSVAKNFAARRDSLTTEDNPSLAFGSPNLKDNGADGTQWAMRSGFGRMTYNYSERYLLEANLRYDLTSRFAKEFRGAWFPSFSGAWRISEENFMSNFRSIINHLKIRASWGILGNQYSTSGNYPYLSTIQSANPPSIGTVINSGTKEETSPIGNPDLLWEKSHTTDFGIDLSILDTRLNITADYYIRNTKDMIVNVPIQGVMGLDKTQKNAATMQNKGWELQLKWNDKIGKDFSYGAIFNLSDVRNKITDMGGAPQAVETYDIMREGAPYQAFYGLIADGLAMPWDFESYNATTGKYTNPKFPVLAADKNIVQPGDIKYKDIDNSGDINLDYDRQVIGSRIPRYTFSLTGDMKYKGVDFSFMLQGVGKNNGYLAGPAQHTFTDQSTYPQKIHEGRYQNSNPNPNAIYPRFTYNQVYNQRFSTFWLEDASYLRIKNIQIGYTLPHKITSKIKISNCRFYASADNIATFSDFYYAYDPESPVQSGGYYPQVKTFVMGVNITFK